MRLLPARPSSRPVARAPLWVATAASAAYATLRYACFLPSLRVVTAAIAAYTTLRYGRFFFSLREATAASAAYATLRSGSALGGDRS